SSRWAMGGESGNMAIYGVDGTPFARVQDQNSVDVLAWSLDGTTLAGGSVSFWDANGKRINYLSRMGSSISALEWSPDSHFLAASSGWSNSTAFYISLWNTDWSSPQRLSGHSASVASLAWSPDGRWLASGSLDQTIRLWNIRLPG
ncbi:MAG: hypothetical protein ABI700_12660, partial [Chloroflexota bacterium]